MIETLSRFDAAQGPRIVGPKDGRLVDIGAIGARFILWGEESGGGFSLVEHPIPPRTLAAPLHRHSREDEYSFVLEGRLGALLGDDVVYAEVGELAFKPRDQWHTFWNAGDTQCRILEMHLAGWIRALLRRRRRVTPACSRSWPSDTGSSSTWIVSRRCARSTDFASRLLRR